MSSQVNRLLLLVLTIVAFTSADYFATRWGHVRDTKNLALVIAIGPFAYLLFGHLAASTSLVQMGAYVNCGIVLGATVAGVLLFGERPDAMTKIGIGVIVIGLLLLGLGKVQGADA